MWLQDEEGRLLTNCMRNNKKYDLTVIEELEKFAYLLNTELKTRTIIVVEGKKDIDALRYLGVRGSIRTYNEFKSTIDLVDTILETNYRIILLLDFDKKGINITKKILSLLGESIVNTHYKNQLHKITKGRVRKIEEIKSFYIKLLKNYA